MPPLVGAEPVRYAAVLVAFEEGTYSEDAMATALRLASHRGGDVRVITTVTVPQHLDINAPLPEAEATAQAVIEAARQWAGRGQRVRGRIVKVRPDEAGHRIVREAIEARSQAIVMPMPAAAAVRQGPQQDARGRAGQAPRPRDHRLGAGEAAGGAPEDGYPWCFNRGEWIVLLCLGAMLRRGCAGRPS